MNPRERWHCWSITDGRARVVDTGNENAMKDSAIRRNETALRGLRFEALRAGEMPGGRVMSAVHIQVTQDDINNGASIPSRCPVACAVRRVCPGHLVEVYPTVVIFVRQGYPAVDLPRVATDFIVAFDHGREVRPVGFDLEVPAALLAGAS